MKFYMVVKYYLESLKFHEDPCTNARARVLNARTRDKMLTARLHLVSAHLCTKSLSKTCASEKSSLDGKLLCESLYDQALSDSRIHS